MPPKTIYIIRHCDKPANYKEEGPSNPKACLCSEQGYQRADLLAAFWKRELNNETNISLFASNYSPNNPSCSCEQREFLVLVPTGKAYNVPVQLPYCFYQIDEMARLMREQTGTVIIAWEHRHIPILTAALTKQELVGPWPEDRFDIVFKINGANGHLDIFTQGLGLPGDSTILPKDYQKYSKNLKGHFLLAVETNPVMHISISLLLFLFLIYCMYQAFH